jgi:AraC family transcriptional regulator
VPELSPFQGTRVADWTSDLFALSETHYGRKHHSAAHAHEGATFAFVLHGGFTERQGSRAIECRPGDVLFRPSALEHDDLFADRETRCFNIDLPADFVPPSARSVVDSRVGGAAWAAQRILAEARRSGPGDPLAVEAQVADLVATLCPPPRSAMTSRMERVCSRLAETFAQSWSLSALAREAQVHPAHFARAFRQAQGESVGQHVHRLRVEYAAKQLARTSVPIAEIAVAAGFADQAHFSRVFRRHTGESPARFRTALHGARVHRSFKTG